MRTLLPQSPPVTGGGPVSVEPMLGALEAEAKMPPNPVELMVETPPLQALSCFKYVAFMVVTELL